MARDISILPPNKQPAYEKIKASLGEAEADKFFDNYFKVRNISVPQAAPIPEQLDLTGLSVTPPAEPAIQPVVQTVVEEPAFKPPTPTELTARLGVGEFAPKPTEADIASEEFKALEAQTAQFVKQGIPTKQDVILQITGDLQAEGLGVLDPQFGKRLEEELFKADYAEKRAMEVVAPARMPRTAEFVPSAPVATPQTIAKDPSQVEQMGGFEAIGRAFMPQELESPAEIKVREQAEKNRIELDKNAAELATKNRISQEEAKKEILRQVQKDFRQDAVREIGFTSTPSDYDALAREKYLNFLKVSLPDEYAYEIGRDEDEAAFGIAGLASTGRAQFEEKAKQGAGAALSFLASDKYDPQVYKDVKNKLGITPKTEAVVESLPLTIVRDLAGLSRFAFNPLLDAALYDVIPGTDIKVNPDDFGLDARERTGRKEEEAWGKSYIAKPSDNPFEDQLREIAVEVATARSLGDDLVSRQIVKPDEEDLIRGLGILSEVGLPINIFSVPGKVAGIGGRGARAISRAARISDDFAGSTSDLFRSLAKVGETLETPTQIPIGLYNAIVIDNKLLNPLKQAAKSVAKAEGVSATIASEIGKSAKLADALIDSNRLSVIEAANTGDRYAILMAIAKGPDDLLVNPAYASTVARMTEVSPDIMNALKNPQVLNPKKFATEVLKRAGDSPLVKDTLSIINTSYRRGGNFIDDVESARSAARTSLQESLSNSILGEWSFLTPNIVISTKLAKSASPVKGKNIVQFVADDIATNMRNYLVFQPEVGKELSAILNASIDVEKLLETSLVYSPNERLKHYKNIFAGLKVGDKMSPEQYKALHTLVSESRIGTLTRQFKLGAFKPEAAGRAYKSASEPEVLRSSIIQYGKQLSEDVIDAIQKLRKKTFVKAPAPRYVTDILNSYAGTLESLPAQLSQTISGLGKLGYKPNEIYGQVLNKSLIESLGAAAVTERILPMTKESASDALKSVMRTQFNYSPKTPQGKAIDALVDDYAKAFVDPETNASLFYEKAKGLRKDIIQKYPEIAGQEVLAQGKAGARTLGRDSLPDTILAVATKETQDKIFKDIVSKNRNKIYDDIAVAKIVDPTEMKLDEVLAAIDSGLAAKLNGYSSADDVLASVKEGLINKGSSASWAQAMIELHGDTFIDVINNYYIDIRRATHGFESASGSEILRRLNLSIKEVEPGVFAYIPAELASDINKVKEGLKAAGKDPVRTERLIKTIDEVERQSPGLMSRIWGDIGAFGGYVHKNIAEGMLAGKVIPNVTYLSENVFTAPLIAAVTNPEYIGTVLKNVPKMAGKTTTGLVGGEFGRFGGYASDLYQPALSFPNKVAIVTPSGEQITNAELWRLFTEARIGAGQAETVLRPQSIAQLKQLSGLVGADNKLLVEAGRRFKDVAPSSTASVPMTVAQNTDMAFRQALFKEAMRRGSTAEEAATIARETLLDYNLLNTLLPSQLNAVRAPFMFLSFSTSMSAAILKALTRGETAENILRMARFHNDMSKRSGVYAPGQAELESLFTEQVGTIGEKPVTYNYFRDPIMGQIFWGANIAENFNNLLTGDASLGGTLQNLLEETAYTPYTGFMNDIASAYKGSMVPPRQIAFAQSTPLWPSMQSNFEIEEIPIEKMRRGQPTFQGKQYRFKTEAGRKKYLGFMFLLTMAGYNRTLNDSMNTLVAGGYAPEGAYLARYYPENPAFEGIQADPSLKGFTNGLLYMIVRQRASKPPTQIEVFDRQMQTEMRKLKDLQLEDVEE